MTIYLSVSLLRPYHEVQHFTVQTNHRALKCIPILSDSRRLLQCWRLHLSEFDIDVIHCAVIKHQAAETLSRLFTKYKDYSLLENDLRLLAIDHVVNKNTSHTTDKANDYHVLNINHYAASTKKPIHNSLTLVELIHAQKNDLFCHTLLAHVGHACIEFSVNSDGLLLRQSAVDGFLQILVPPSLCQHILIVTHHTPVPGDPGQRRIRDPLHCSFY